VILAYHRVNPWYSRDALSVSPEKFQRQVKFLLTGGWQPLPPGLLLEEIRSGPEKLKGKRWFLITFDDGYADNFWFAWPILREFNVPPIVFVNAGYISSHYLLPRYHDSVRDRFLTWSEIEEMSQKGVIFGSHGLTHRRLTTLSPEEARREISDSRRLLQEKVGQSVEFFCYPYGDYNETVVSLVRQAGYLAGMVTSRRMPPVSPYSLPRTGVYGQTGQIAFLAKLGMGTWRERRFFGLWQSV